MNIKFLSLNVWRGGVLFDELIDFLKSESPDIMSLQEVYSGSDCNVNNQFRTLETLQAELNYPYIDFAPAFLDNRSIGKVQSGNAVFSKLPIVESETTFFGEPYREVNEEADYADKSKFDAFITYPRNLQHVTIRFGKSMINVFNTHGVWGFEADDNERRIKMSEIIIRAVENKNNTILSGDFNVKENTRTIDNIEQHLQNVFKNKLATTFNLKRKKQPGFIAEVVDFIFVSKDIKVTKYTSPQVDVSDHMPLICFLEID